MWFLKKNEVTVLKMKLWDNFKIILSGTEVSLFSRVMLCLCAVYVVYSGSYHYCDLICERKVIMAIIVSMLSLHDGLIQKLFGHIFPLSQSLVFIYSQGE